MLTTAIVFLIILSLLVFVHELGHFVVARLIGVKVEEFGFGLPPRIFGRKIKGTIYSFNWLPIGGFVRLAGEDDGEAREHAKGKQNVEQYFWARTKKERAAILLAGVAMNFLLAVVLTTYLLVQGVPVPSGRVHIEKVLAGSPAESIGLKAQDSIVAIGGKMLTTPKELIEETKTHLGEQITLTILRDGKELSMTLTPRKDYPKGEGPMGVAISDLEIKKYPLSTAPIEATKINLSRAKEMVTGIGQIITRLVTLKPLGADVAGPIGIAQVTGQAVKFGLSAVLEFMSILSLNLAVLNVLPIPALDGGRLLFVFAEKILGRKVAPAFERSTHQIGMIILFILILLVSINDILRITRGG